METTGNFSFSDADLYLRFFNHPFTSSHAEPPDDTSCYPFPPFEHPALIQALYELNNRKAYRLLSELTEPLTPHEAAAACLCAVLGSNKLLNTVLDHCPPIPDFQFKGVGQVSNLIALVVKFDLEKKLRILLHRGADPNKGSDSLSPLEIAFTHGSYSSLWELLKVPHLEIELTEPILNIWGQLSTSPDAVGADLVLQWCCQSICEKLNPSPLQFPGIIPECIPPQLRPRHALAHGNMFLAAQICETNPMNEEDYEDLLAHFDDHFPLPLHPHSPLSNERTWNAYTTLLKAYTRHVPDFRDHPILRRAIACAAVATPTTDEELLSAAAQLPDGPIHLKANDILYLSNGTCLSFSRDLLTPFSSKWDELLGDWLPLALDLNELTPSLLSLPNSRALFTHFIFTGSIEDEKWDELMEWILLKLITFDQELDQLFRPGRLLSHVPSDKLLALIPQLSLHQRSAILMHTKEGKDFAL